MTNRLRPGIRVACLWLAVGLGTAVAAQEGGAAAPDLQWTPWVSDLPMVDLSGTWTFEAAASDPMVEVWQGRGVEYWIAQQSNSIVLEFRPEDGQSNQQTYTWSGAVAAFRRDDSEVRERARWTERGRALEIEGRRWPIDDVESVTTYRFLYRLVAADELLFLQSDEYGETRWIFRRD